MSRVVTFHCGDRIHENVYDSLTPEHTIQRDFQAWRTKVIQEFKQQSCYTTKTSAEDEPDRHLYIFVPESCSVNGLYHYGCKGYGWVLYSELSNASPTSSVNIICDDEFKGARGFTVPVSCIQVAPIQKDIHTCAVSAHSPKKERN